MTKYNIRITRQAKEHLERISDYITDVILEPNTALKLSGLLKEEMLSLEEAPERIKRIEEEPWRSYGIRKKRVKNYYIYFWINAKKRQVQILAVIYVRMDQVEQLRKMAIK